MPTCPACHNEIEHGADPCPHCGAGLNWGEPQPYIPPQQDAPPSPPPAPQIPPVLQQFTQDGQDSATVQQIHRRVSQLLTSGEEILYIAVQSNPLNLTPDAFILTSRRFIRYTPKLFGRVDFRDYIWRDLQDAHLKEGILGATVTMKTVQGFRLILDYLPKQQARKLYAVAQEMEEKVREERRLREMEEKRAAAGGVIFQGAIPGVPQASAPQEDPIAKLEQLKVMLDKGLITADEYESKKQEILSRM